MKKLSTVRTVKMAHVRGGLIGAATIFTLVFVAGYMLVLAVCWALFVKSDDLSTSDSAGWALLFSLPVTLPLNIMVSWKLAARVYRRIARQ